MVQNKQSRARHLYMADSHSQREIAQKLQVSERTLYTWIKTNGWDRLRRAARTAPVVVTDNLYSELVELQDAIAARAEGQRFPTLQEAEVIRKLVTCIDKMKKAPSLSQNMQMLHLFKSFARDRDDRRFNWKLEGRIERFLEADAKGGYYPYQPEYDTAPAPKQAFEEDDAAKGPAWIYAANSDARHTSTCMFARPPFKQQSGATNMPESLSYTASQPISGTPEMSEETGSKSEVDKPTSGATLVSSPACRGAEETGSISEVNKPHLTPPFNGRSPFSTAVASAKTCGEGGLGTDAAFLAKNFPTRLSALRGDNQPPI